MSSEGLDAEFQTGWMKGSGQGWKWGWVEEEGEGWW